MRKMLCALALTVAPAAAQAAWIDLEITVSWEAANFFVDSTGPDGATGAAEENDDKVFGIAPAAGGTTVTLRVDADSARFYAGGSTDPDFGVLDHDWYGYDVVTLPGGHSVGTASWTTADIISRDGPGGAAPLWTNADLTTTDPTLMSFRMFGDWIPGETSDSADLFVGGTMTAGIGGGAVSALRTGVGLAEYFGGERIGGASFTATASPAVVPAPAAALLLPGGLAALALAGRRRRR